MLNDDERSVWYAIVTFKSVKPGGMLDEIVHWRSVLLTHTDWPTAGTQGTFGKPR